MSDLNLNLNNNSQDQYIKFELATNRPDEEEGEKKKFVELPLYRKIVSYLYAFINGQLQDLKDEIELNLTVFVSDSVIQHIRNLRALFRHLQEEDISQSLDYALKLSKSWHGIISYHQLATSKEVREEAYKKISKLVDLFNRYPTADEHALGHYLSNYAGENWLPFPFMNILRDLHEEHITSGDKSNLAKLIKLLTNIIESFQLVYSQQKSSFQQQKAEEE